MSTYSSVLFLLLYFDLLHVPKKHCENINITVKTVLVSPLPPLIVFAVLLFYRAQQEPEEAIRATHQVILPGRGSERPPLPSVSRRHGQHQRAVVVAYSTRHTSTVHLGDPPPVYICVSAIQVSVVVCSPFSFSWIKTVMLSLP